MLGKFSTCADRTFLSHVLLLLLIAVAGAQLNNILGFEYTDLEGLLGQSADSIGQTLDFVLSQLPPQNAWECSETSQRAQEVVGRVCDCNLRERNCNPLCPGSYIQCNAGRSEVVMCPAGTFFNPLDADCVPPDFFSFLCPVLTTLGLDTPASQQCLAAECFCQTHSNGIYANPFDEFCQSYIVCNSDFLASIEKVQLCGNGQRFNSATLTCVAAEQVSCGDAPVDSCSDPMCFCLHKPPGIYDNIFDFEMNSAIECGSCGTFHAIWYGPPDHVFNGQDFVPIPNENAKPQVCGQITGGIKPESGFISELLFGSNPDRSQSSNLQPTTMNNPASPNQPAPFTSQSTQGNASPEANSQGGFFNGGNSRGNGFDTTNSPLGSSSQAAQGGGFGGENLLGNTFDGQSIQTGTFDGTSAQGGGSNEAVGSNNGRRLSATNFLNTGLATVPFYNLDTSLSAITPNCERSLLLWYPRNGYQMVPATSCDPKLRCPRNVQSAFVRVNCRLLYCINGCGIIASSRNLCTQASSYSRTTSTRSVG